MTDRLSQLQDHLDKVLYILILVVRNLLYSRWSLAERCSLGSHSSSVASESLDR